MTDEQRARLLAAHSWVERDYRSVQPTRGIVLHVRRAGGLTGYCGNLVGLCGPLTDDGRQAGLLCGGCVRGLAKAEQRIVPV